MLLDELDIFMAAIRKLESGSFDGNYKARNSSSGAYGAYQIMPQYWDGWAAEAGLRGARSDDPVAQDAVARYKFLQYYDKYQDWSLVAIAWFAGGTRADAAQKNGLANIGGISDGNTTIREYVEKIGRFMTEYRETLPDEQVDPIYGAPIGDTGAPLSQRALDQIMAQWGVAGVTPSTYTAEVSNPNDDIAALLAAIQGGAGTGQVATSMLAQGLKSLSNSVKKKHRFDMSSADTDLLRLISEETE